MRDGTQQHNNHPTVHRAKDQWQLIRSSAEPAVPLIFTQLGAPYAIMCVSMFTILLGFMS